MHMIYGQEHECEKFIIETTHTAVTTTNFSLSELNNYVDLAGDDNYQLQRRHSPPSQAQEREVHLANALIGSLRRYLLPISFHKY